MLDMRRSGRRGRVTAWLLVIALAFGAMGCEKSAREKLGEADAAVRMGDADRAQAALDEAVAKDPKVRGAAILQAQIHMLRKQYEKSEAALNELWKAEGLDGDKLSTEQKSLKKRLEGEHYPTLYREWADAIDAQANPKKYEEVVTKGLKYDKKNPRLNTVLVEFYEKRAEKLIGEGKKAEAAETLDKIYPLYTASKRRSAAQDRATKLRQELFLEAATARFEKELKPKLVEEERWDEEGKAVIIALELEVDRKLPDEDAKKLAYAKTSEAFNAFTRQLGGLGEDVKMGVAYKLEGFKVIEEENKRGTYTIKSSLPIDTLVAYARLAHERHEKAKEEAAKEKKGEGDAAKKDGDAAKKDGEGKKDGEKKEGGEEQPASDEKK